MRCVRDPWGLLAVSGEGEPHTSSRVTHTDSVVSKFLWPGVTLDLSQPRWEGCQRQLLTRSGRSPVSTLKYLRSAALETPVEPATARCPLGDLSTEILFFLERVRLLKAPSLTWCQIPAWKLPPGMLSLDWKETNIKRVLLRSLKSNLCRLWRHLTHKFPFLATRALRERVFLAWRILRTCGPAASCLSGSKRQEDKETLRCVFHCQQKTNTLGQEPGRGRGQGSWFGT